MYVLTAETTVTLLGFAADPRRGSRGCPFVEETDKRSVQRPPLSVIVMCVYIITAYLHQFNIALWQPCGVIQRALF